MKAVKTSSKKRIAATVRAHEKGLSVAHACRLMGLSRSTFYASQKTTPAQIKTDELAEKISEVQSSCFFTIGRRRMGAVLHKRYGIEVCETTLQRVMSRRGLTARIRQVRKAKPCAGKATRQQLPDNFCSTVSSKLIGRCTASLLMSPMCRTSKTTNGTGVICRSYRTFLIAPLSLGSTPKSRMFGWDWRHSSFYQPRLGSGSDAHSDRGSIYTAQAFRDAADGMGLTQSFSRTAN